MYLRMYVMSDQSSPVNSNKVDLRSAAACRQALPACLDSLAMPVDHAVRVLPPDQTILALTIQSFLSFWCLSSVIRGKDRAQHSKDVADDRAGGRPH